MVFGRRKRRDEELSDDDDAAAVDSSADAALGVPEDAPRGASGEASLGVDAATASGVASTTGPWDLADAPDDEIQRIDLGGLRVPVPEDGELRVDVEPESQIAQAVLVVVGDSVLQIGAFAAPKTAGIWAEVADEIVAGIRQSGGSAEPVQGPFGRELRANVPVEDEHGRRGTAPTRFFGVDGPRWFVRGLLQGPAVEGGAAAVFEQVFRDTIVVRGGEAMAPR